MAGRCSPKGSHPSSHAPAQIDIATHAFSRGRVGGFHVAEEAARRLHFPKPDSPEEAWVPAQTEAFVGKHVQSNEPAQRTTKMESNDPHQSPPRSFQPVRGKQRKGRI